jgi:ribosome modulation factor
MSEVGHNTKAADAVTAFQLSQLMNSLADKKSSDAKHSNLIGRLQAKGLNTEAAREAIRIHESGDPAEKVEYLETLATYLRVLGTPLQSNQTDLFKKPEGEQTPEEKAAIAGHRAGIMGEGQGENPHAGNSEQGQAWLRAWHEGCAERKKLVDQFTAEELTEADQPEGDETQADIEDGEN